MASPLYKYVARLQSLISYLFIGVSLFTCKPEVETIYPINQSINEPLPSDPNWKYRILEVTFAGIPSKNVKIDQQKRFITVDIPANYPGGEMKPKFVLTKNTTTLWGDGDSFWSENLCGCNNSWTVRIGPWEAYTNSKYTTYTISFITTAPLTFKSLTNPLEIPLTRVIYISLPVNNPYANDPILRAFAQAIGKEPILLSRPGWNYEGCSSFWCDRKMPSTVSFDFSPYSVPALVPGVYNLFLELKSGRRITLSQPVQFIRGAIQVNNSFGYSISAGETSFVMTGENLFSTELTGKITAPNGQVWQVNPISSAPDGLWLAISIPVLKPGYYSLQLFRNNIAVGSCTRISVRYTSNHPTIKSINDVASCFAQDSVRLSRNVQHPIQYSYSGTKTSLKLVSLTEPDHFYTIPFLNSYSQFTIPESIPPGPYKTSIIAQFGSQLLESEPYEQPVIVQ